MKKQPTTKTHQQKNSSLTKTDDSKLEAKKAAKSIDTANRDAPKDDRKSGM